MVGMEKNSLAFKAWENQVHKMEEVLAPDVGRGNQNYSLGSVWKVPLPLPLPSPTSREQEAHGFPVILVITWLQGLVSLGR